MKKYLPSFICLLIISAIFIFPSCKKDRLLTDNQYRLSFSSDTLTFDTVFTTLGSTTKSFKIINNNSGKLNISNIRLGGGEQSNFRLNIDGEPGNEAKNLEVNGKDSMYVFVAVTVDPNNQNNPVVLIDSVLFETNGNLQKVYLMAWGQDAYIYKFSQFICNETWTKDKPYVIINSLGIDSGCTLTIETGTRIFVGGNNSGIYVLPTAKIIVNGSQADSVIFRGIRLERFFEDKPGQWDGIFILRGSTGNVFNYAEIVNSDFGLSIGSGTENPSTYSFADAPEVLLKNTVIKNSLRYGLFGFLSRITAENCLVYNSGDHLVALAYGGEYNFTHCTFANYGNIFLSHRKSVALISNLFCDQNGNCNIAETDAKFTNCIIYGSLEEEIDTSFLNPESGNFKFFFENCLVRTKRDISDDSKFLNCIKNEDPQFKDRVTGDFRLNDNSPARDAGKPTTVQTDIDGNPRGSIPDIGCYEF